VIATAAFILALSAPITGVVHDSTGDVIAGAAIIVRATSGPERRVTTGSDGRFTIDAPDAGDLTLIVRAGGFAEKTERVPAAHTGELDVVLAPASLFETVTVTPTRTEQRLGDTPASVDVVTAKDIEASPALVADDVLRQVPTFSLFRRTSSLVAQPTTQGVSLRGIGPSGQSRTLVLLDGIPFNDPFGGWVYWTRVPLESVDRIEVVDGSSSSLYGNYAMGGVINIVSSRPARRTLELKPQYGNHASPKFDFFGSDVWGKVGAVVEGSVFDTDGFPIVAANERGIIDNNATVSAFAKDGSKVADAVVVLKSVRSEGGKATFDVAVLEGDLANADGPAAVFIDTVWFSLGSDGFNYIGRSQTTIGGGDPAIGSREDTSTFSGWSNPAPSATGGTPVFRSSRQRENYGYAPPPLDAYQTNPACGKPPLLPCY